MKRTLRAFLALLVVVIFSCDKDDDSANTLSVNQTQITLPAAGGQSMFYIETNASSWSIDNPSDWVILSEESGTDPTSTVTLQVTSQSVSDRSTTLTVSAGNAPDVTITVTQAAAGFAYVISTDKDALSYPKEATSIALEVTTNAPDWSITSDAEWLQIDPNGAGAGVTTINIAAPLYDEDDWRYATISITATDAVTVEIPVIQKGDFYPGYNTSPEAPDATGMSSTAVQLAADMHLGWNIGNTLEAIGSEIAWGNPMVTEQTIQLVKQNGFNAIRIPCSWNQYIEDEETVKISDTWLNRVEEVVQYCVNNDMYAVLNIHWDQGWLEENCTPEMQDEVKSKQRALWQQIATKLRAYDEHLIFASANEPHVDDATQMSVLLSYHQAFVDAVRGTGGKNSYRTLVVQGPATDIEKTDNLMNTLPTDTATDRMMAEVHFYTPYQFCLMTEDQSWGNMFYYWGQGYHSATDTTRNATWGEEATVDNLFQSMKTKFVDQGIPVIMGEYAVVRRSSLTGANLQLHLDSRAYFLEYVTGKAIENGLIPFYWDAGNMGDNSTALFDRANNTVYDQQALDAIIAGGGN